MFEQRTLAASISAAEDATGKDRNPTGPKLHPPKGRLHSRERSGFLVAVSVGIQIKNDLFGALVLAFEGKVDAGFRSLPDRR
jgi:hypothetical protein